MIDDNNNDCSSQQRDESSSNKRQVTFHPQGESVYETLLTAIASIEQVDPDELPVLNDAIDPDALDAVFEPHPDGTDRTSDVAIFFTYAGYEVRVESDGVITLSPTSNQDQPE